MWAMHSQVDRRTLCRRVSPWRRLLEFCTYYIGFGAAFQSPAVQDLKQLGKQYVQDMRSKVPPSRSNATHVVDKMLRNSWNVGYISMMLPQACIIQVQ